MKWVVCDLSLAKATRMQVKTMPSATQSEFQSVLNIKWSTIFENNLKISYEDAICITDYITWNTKEIH